MLEHEGIEVLGYETENGDHPGFDEYLKAIHAKTAPARILGDLLNRKKLLWLDPKPDNNLYGKKVIDETADMGCEMLPNNGNGNGADGPDDEGRAA